VNVVDNGDGTLRMTLAVADVSWLSTLLLQIGPGVEVLSPPELVSLPAEAAERLLARYER
jgi:predicted DNA-binding transcriptional regulator YafY